MSLAAFIPNDIERSIFWCTNCSLLLPAWSWALPSSWLQPEGYRRLQVDGVYMAGLLLLCIIALFGLHFSQSISKQPIACPHLSQDIPYARSEEAWNYCTDTARYPSVCWSIFRCPVVRKSSLVPFSLWHFYSSTAAYVFHSCLKIWLWWAVGHIHKASILGASHASLLAWEYAQRAIL